MAGPIFRWVDESTRWSRLRLVERPISAMLDTPLGYPLQLFSGRRVGEPDGPRVAYRMNTLKCVTTQQQILESRFVDFREAKKKFDSGDDDV